MASTSSRHTQHVVAGMALAGRKLAQDNKPTILPNGDTLFPNGDTLLADGTDVLANGDVVLPNGDVVLADGTVVDNKKGGRKLSEFEQTGVVATLSGICQAYTICHGGTPDAA